MIPAPVRLGCAALLFALNGSAMETRVESLDLRETQRANWQIPNSPAMTPLSSASNPLHHE